MAVRRLRIEASSSTTSTRRSATGLDRPVARLGDELVHGVGGHWPAEIKPLRPPAVKTFQIVELAVGLDAFGRDFKIEGGTGARVIQ